jgi:hypothetical protein
LAAGRAAALHLPYITAVSALVTLGKLHMASLSRQDSLAKKDATIPKLHENPCLFIPSRISACLLQRIPSSMSWAISLPLRCKLRSPCRLQPFNLLVYVIANVVIFEDVQVLGVLH